MNKFMRLFAVLLVVIAIALIVVAFKMGGDKKPAAVASHQAPAASRTSAPAPVTYSVVTAAVSLQPGEAITTDELAVKQLPRQVAGSYASVDEVVGKVPAIAVSKGSLLTKNMLIHGLSLKLKPGERAMAIPVTNVTGTANRIHPGDYVDLFFSLKTRDQSGTDRKEHTQARLLLPRLRVLAFGHDDLPKAATPAPAASSSKAKQADTAQRGQARDAVLAVPVNMVNRLLLVMADQQGTLSLVLRNPSDKGMPDPSLFPQPGPVLVAKAQPHKAAAGDPIDPNDNPDSAVNQAYAGVSLDGLAQGGTSHRQRPKKHYVPRVRRVDIIRGTERGHITVPNH